jgi:hypothetical protein
MSPMPTDEPPEAGNGETPAQSFWGRMGQAVDAYFAERSRRVVPATTMRRSRQELARCRRMLIDRSRAAMTEAGRSDPTVARMRT